MRRLATARRRIAWLLPHAPSRENWILGADVLLVYDEVKCGASWFYHETAETDRGVKNKTGGTH
jgi:hypothetical protein